MGEPDSPLLFGGPAASAAGPFTLSGTCPEDALTSDDSGCHRGVSGAREASGKVFLNRFDGGGQDLGEPPKNPGRCGLLPLDRTGSGTGNGGKQVEPLLPEWARGFGCGPFHVARKRTRGPFA